MKKTFGLFLKSARKKAGLTQIELARLAGIGKTAVFDLEHDKSTAQLDTLLKILHVLNISIELVDSFGDRMRIQGSGS